MRLHNTNTNATDNPRSLNPKGCRVTPLGTPLPLGSFTTIGKVEISKPAKNKSSRHAGATQMKYRNDGFILPEYAFKARPAEAGLLSIATGGLHSGKAVLVRPAGPSIQDHDATVMAIQDHATSVTGVTYNKSVTLLMCRYLARPSSGEIRKLILVESQCRLTCLEEPPYRKSRGCAKIQPNRPPCGQGTSTFGPISRAADTTPNFIEIQLPENGNERRLR
jgi:hypothetical protein